MLQEAVDALFDNGRRSKAIRGRGSVRSSRSPTCSEVLAKQAGFRPEPRSASASDYSGVRHVSVRVQLTSAAAEADGPRALQAVHHP